MSLLKPKEACVTKMRCRLPAALSLPVVLSVSEDRTRAERTDLPSWFCSLEGNWIQHWSLLQFPQTENKDVYKTKATYNLVQTCFRILFLHSGNQGRCGHGRNGASSVTPKHLSLNTDLSKPGSALPGTARIVWLFGQTSGTKCSEHPQQGPTPSHSIAQYTKARKPTRLSFFQPN